MQQLIRRIITLWFFTVLVAFSFPAWAQRSATSEPLAEVNGAPITAEEVDKPIAAQLSKLDEQIYNLRRQRVEALINERLLSTEAAKRRIAVPALLDGEVTSKVGLVTEQEIENFYQANKARYPGDESAGREQIRALIQNQKLAQRRQEFIESLRAQAKIVINLKAPPVSRVDVKIDGAPFKGPVKAPVTFVEFTDFHCPFCKQVLPTLTQLLSRYGEKVQLVFKDFPIDQLHPQARRGHEAARCANEQGKFWTYHDQLYQNAPKTELGDLKNYAKQVGLDVTAFEKCYASGKYKAAVDKDIEEGKRLGVTGTPAFFVNGRLVSGAQPLDAFVRVIDDELARGK